MSRGVSRGCDAQKQPSAVFPGLHARLRGGLGRGLAGVALLVTATIVLSACGAASTTGSAGASPYASTSATTLAAVVGRLDRLDVRRTDAFPQNRFSFAFPAKVTTTDPAAGRCPA